MFSFNFLFFPLWNRPTPASVLPLPYHAWTWHKWVKMVVKTPSGPHMWRWVPAEAARLPIRNFHLAVAFVTQRLKDELLIYFGKTLPHAAFCFKRHVISKLHWSGLTLIIIQTSHMKDNLINMDSVVSVKWKMLWKMENAGKTKVNQWILAVDLI